MRKILILIIISFIISIPVQAQTKCTGTNGGLPEKAIQMQIYIPGVTLSCQTETMVFQNGQFTTGQKTLYYVMGIKSYISSIYKLFIGVVSLGAIVVIMLGGFQYVWAAGNQQKISNAKSMISGALGGLVLALLSYTLLNTINPRIISLDITKPEDVKSITAAPFDRCYQYPSGTRVVNTQSAQEVTIQWICQDTNTGAVVDCNNPSAGRPVPDMENSYLHCGQSFYIWGSQQSIEDKPKTCVGNYCVHGKICLNKDPLGYNPSCEDGLVGGSITFDPGAYIDNNLKLSAACSNGTRDVIADINLPSPIEQRFYIINSAGLSDACGGDLKNPTNPGTQGSYFLEIEVNDPGSIFTAGTGIDDWYAIDRTCKRPLHSDDPKNRNYNTISSDNLITYQELLRGFICNIEIKRLNFPDR